jgi:hypothetical protein
MSIAPEPILRAGNDTVSWACIFCRNQTLQEGAPTKMINDAMEAIHEVPRMLIDWERHDLAEVRMHLAGFRRLAGQEHRIWFCILTRD